MRVEQSSETRSIVSQETSVKIEPILTPINGKIQAAAFPIKGISTNETKTYLVKKFVPYLVMIKSNLLDVINRMAKASADTTLGIKSKEDVERYLAACWDSAKEKFDAIYQDHAKKSRFCIIKPFIKI